MGPTETEMVKILRKQTEIPQMLIKVENRVGLNFEEKEQEGESKR